MPQKLFTDSLNWMSKSEHSLTTCGSLLPLWSKFVMDYCLELCGLRP